MSAELHGELIKYLDNLPLATAPELGRNMSLGREADNKLVSTILDIQQNLQPDQVLVMRVALAEPDEEYKELDGYRGIVHDAPIDLLAVIRKEIKLGHIKIEEMEGNAFPEQIEMVIPPNVIPAGDGIPNTSSSRASVLTGEVKRFLDRSDVRTVYLGVDPSGFWLRPKFHMHPSVIKDLRIEDVKSDVGSVPQIKFRVVK